MELQFEPQNPDHLAIARSIQAALDRIPLPKPEEHLSIQGN